MSGLIQAFSLLLFLVLLQQPAPGVTMRIQSTVDKRLESLLRTLRALAEDAKLEELNRILQKDEKLEKEEEAAIQAVVNELGAAWPGNNPAPKAEDVLKGLRREFLVWLNETMIDKRKGYDPTKINMSLEKKRDIIRLWYGHFIGHDPKFRMIYAAEFQVYLANLYKDAVKAAKLNPQDLTIDDEKEMAIKMWEMVKEDYEAKEDRLFDSGEKFKECYDLQVKFLVPIIKMAMKSPRLASLMRKAGIL